MSKRKRGKRRLAAGGLCIILAVTNTIPSVGFQVSASELETEQEDFFESETYSGGVFGFRN